MYQSGNHASTILLVDDESQSLQTTSFILQSEGFQNIMTCTESTKVLELCRSNQISLVLMDISMPNLTGMELLPLIKEAYPGTAVVMLTAAHDVETAVLCMKYGAFDYLLKPTDKERVIATVRHAIEYRELQKENFALKEQLLCRTNEVPSLFDAVITEDESMLGIFKYIQAIAHSSMPVLIDGETGTGKELIAESIHKCSGRSGEFVAVNIAGIDDNMFSDVIFGHIRGAFTGAESSRKGIIEQAAQGTLFLDEIGDLSMESQIKLLRVLQDRKYYPAGSDVSKPSTARIIVATNCNIVEMQKIGKFRKDLFFRLQTHHIKIPPLRERKGDIPLLVDSFLEIASKEYQKKKPTPPRELYDLLGTYDFPGNVRELQSMVFDAVSRHVNGIMSMSAFKEKIGYYDSGANAVIDNCKLQYENQDDTVQFRGQLPTLKNMEEILIDKALSVANGNQSVAADMLGISRRALNNRLIRAKV